jgi:hypothetical protein
MDGNRFSDWGAVMLRFPLRRFFVAFFSCGLISSGLGGCSIHPLPEDVTGYKTATIVRKIRCEARDAVVKALVEILHKHNRHQEIDDSNVLDLLKTVQLNAWELKKLYELENIGIVYDFSLHGNETDDLSFSATILKPLKNGTETFSPSLGNMTERDNVRAFTVSDSFTSLLKLTTVEGDRHHCRFEGNPGPNFEYPIAGRIGLDEMIHTFVRLSVSGDLIAPEDPSTGTPSVNPSGSPTMVDTLTFTTTLSAGLTPAIALTPAGTALQLTNASLPGSVSRMDVHKVIIGMAVGKSVSKLSPAEVAKLLTPKTTALLFTANPKDVSRSGEALAAQAITQYFIRNNLHRLSLAITP